MNSKIKQILKAAGVKNEAELYSKYGSEAEFIKAHPEVAQKLQMGGTPEAFNMSMPMDKFFSYGVPTPPTIHRDGGSLTNVPVYPQIQTEAQFFVPTYSNSNNAYKVGGSYLEAFPQAKTLGWAPTTYAFQGGGAFSPDMAAMSAATGMLPQMQSGSGIKQAIRDDFRHFYDGAPSMQDGGMTNAPTTDAPFAVNRLNDFMGRLREQAYTKAIKNMEMGNEGMEMRRGGKVLPKAQTGTQMVLPGIVSTDQLLDHLIVISPQGAMRNFQQNQTVNSQNQTNAQSNSSNNRSTSASTTVSNPAVVDSQDNPQTTTTGTGTTTTGTGTTATSSAATNNYVTKEELAEIMKGINPQQSQQAQYPYQYPYPYPYPYAYPPQTGYDYMPRGSYPYYAKRSVDPASEFAAQILLNQLQQGNMPQITGFSPEVTYRGDILNLFRKKENRRTGLPKKIRYDFEFGVPETVAQAPEVVVPKKTTGNLLEGLSNLPGLRDEQSTNLLPFDSNRISINPQDFRGINVETGLLPILSNLVSQLPGLSNMSNVSASANTTVPNNVVIPSETPITESNVALAAGAQSPIDYLLNFNRNLAQRLQGNDPDMLEARIMTSPPYIADPRAFNEMFDMRQLDNGYMAMPRPNIANSSNEFRNADRATLATIVMASPEYKNNPKTFDALFDVTQDTQTGEYIARPKKKRGGSTLKKYQSNFDSGTVTEGINITGQPEVLGLQPNPMFDYSWDTGLEPPQFEGMDKTQEFLSKQNIYEPTDKKKISITDRFKRTYANAPMYANMLTKLLEQQQVNPYLGMDVADQFNLTPASRGNYRINAGDFRANQMVPVQDYGTGIQMSQVGGSIYPFDTGEGYYLTQNMLNKLYGNY